MMKKQLIYLLTALLMTCFTSTAWAWSGSGTSADPYLIANAADWNTLATNSASNTYSGKYFKLTADISVSTMVGTNGSRFAGIFDGNGHTLTFNQGTSGSPFGDAACAPFRFVCSASIKRLHVTGTIYTSNQYAGMVARVMGAGTTHINRCHSSLNIHSSRVGDGTSGGLVGYIDNDGNAQASISNCLFDGTLSGSNTTNCGGLVGWAGTQQSEINNCLFAPSDGAFGFKTEGSATISRYFSNHMSISNCYCTVEVNDDNQATDASGMTNEQLLAALGSGWTISGSKVVPAIVGTPIVGAVAKVDDFYYTSFADALAEWTGGATLTLLADIAYASPITVDGKIVVLDLNGYGIRHTGSEGVFCIVHGADFTLNDSNPDTEHRFSIDENGFATLDEANGSLTIHGGYITGGLGCGNTAYLNPGYKDGGAFFLFDNASMTMNAGTLIGNGETINNNRTGGAVFITLGSHFIMNGGTITRNRARYGGGISLYGSTTADISFNAPSVLEIHGGEISYNYATGNSGGVHTNARSCNETVYITGGSIINNWVPENQNAAGMYVEHTGTTVHMSGNPVIKDNYSGSVQKGLQLTNNATLRFDGDMTNTEPIHIYMMATDVPFTNGLGTHADASNFVSDNPTYGVKINSSGEAIMAQAAGIETHPSAINTTYTGVAQTLVTAGTAINGTMAYSLDRITWSTSIPQATNAGNYTVYYRVVGDDTHGDIEPNPNSVEVTIAKTDPTYTAPTANPNPVKYDGYSKQVFWSQGSTSDGTMYYQVTTTNTQPGKSEGTWTSTWDSSITHRINAGTYYLWYYVKGDENHLDTEVLGPVSKELLKGTRTYTKPKADGSSHKSWTGSPQTLFNTGSGTGTATLMYLVTESNTQPSKSDAGWANTIPQKTDIGTYYLWYYLDGGDNYEDTDVNTDIINRNIVKAYPSVTAPVAKTIPYDGESHELVTAGSTSLFTMEYKVGDGDWSSSIPSAIAIGDYTVSYRVVPDDPEHYNTYGPSNVYAHIKAPVASITTSADVTTLYTEFNDALISAWVDGSTLKLLKAAEAGSWYSMNNKGDLTLDLNGFGIKSTSSQYQYATFNLSGTTNVTIIDSNPTATHKFLKDEYDNYATLNESSGNITISGGYITNAPRSAFNVGSGSTLTMNAGTLIGNHSSYTGAAVNVSGTFTMNGGAIMHNYSDQSGTGVYVESDATFKLYGGSITYNLTNGGQGAGVGTSSAANFYMHGQPEIRYNQTLYGEASNVYLHYDEYGERSNDVVIQIDGTLNQSEKYRVGIQSGFHANSGSFVFTSGLATNSGGAYDFHQFFSNDQGYYPIRQSYYDSNEAELYKGSTTLETPTTPTVNGPYTYDGSSHAMLSAPSVSNGGVVKYQYQYRKKNKSETWESWSSWGDWYTYDALPVITDAGEYRVRAKAFADGMPGFNDSGTSSYATFTINKGQSELLTAPLGKTGLVYTGSPQDLIDSNNPGTSDHGTVVYSLTGPVNYHQEIPQGTLAGTYRVYYGVEGNYNYRGNFGVEYVDVTIAPLSVSENDYDIADFFSPYIGSSISLRIERTLLKNGYFNTLCLPFDLSASEIAASNLAGCELFVFAEAEMEENEETGDPQLRQVITPATSIQAGVPYLIRWKNSGPTITELVFSEVTIQNAMGDGVDPSAISTDGVQFLGFVPRTRIEAGNHNYLFLGQNNTLYWPANDDPGTMKGFRAYFYIPTGTTINNAPVYHGMPARLVIRENAPTAIESVQPSAINTQKIMENGIMYIIKNGVKYNAQGQVVK